jgi:hypothetical protein
MNDILGWIVGGLRPALIVESYAFVGYAAAHLSHQTGATGKRFQS